MSEKVTVLFSDDQVENTTELLKSIAHPIRLKILCYLMAGEKKVSDIEQQFDSTISNISQHLTVLRKAGIITRRKQANFMFYSISNERIITLMQALKTSFC